MAERYEPTTVIGWHCHDCGSVVIDTDEHDRFHAAVSDNAPASATEVSEYGDRSADA